MDRPSGSMIPLEAGMVLVLTTDSSSPKVGMVFVLVLVIDSKSLEVGIVLVLVMDTKSPALESEDCVSETDCPSGRPAGIEG